MHRKQPKYFDPEAAGGMGKRNGATAALDAADDDVLPLTKLHKSGVRPFPQYLKTALTIDTDTASTFHALVALEHAFLRTDCILRAHDIQRDQAWVTLLRGCHPAHGPASFLPDEIIVAAAQHVQVQHAGTYSIAPGSLSRNTTLAGVLAHLRDHPATAHSLFQSLRQHYQGLGVVLAETQTVAEALRLQHMAAQSLAEKEADLVRENHRLKYHEEQLQIVRDELKEATKDGAAAIEDLQFFKTKAHNLTRRLARIQETCSKDFQPRKFADELSSRQQTRRVESFEERLSELCANYEFELQSISVRFLATEKVVNIENEGIDVL
jgi:hypothetical protein